jgi:hypothetical protein
MTPEVEVGPRTLSRPRGAGRAPSRRGLPHDVDLVLAVDLAKRPADRFRSADDLAAALGDAPAGQLAPAVRAGLAEIRTGGWADPPAAAMRPRPGERLAAPHPAIEIGGGHQPTMLTG